MATIRSFDRTPNDLRPVNIEVDINRFAEGSCLVSYGFTKVHCTASVEDRVPGFMKGEGRGWVTAEYAMLPRSTDTRNRRERERVSGRSAEIQRLIGRSLRAAVNMELLGERAITLDCDVLQADGGTRTASITGAYVALAIAVKKLQAKGVLPTDKDPIVDSIAAVSVGMRGGEHLLDLDFSEDSGCDVDMNIVMTGSGKYIEVQGTAEEAPFAKSDMDAMSDLAASGIAKLTELQAAAINRAVIDA